MTIISSSTKFNSHPIYRLSPLRIMMAEPITTLKYTSPASAKTELQY